MREKDFSIYSPNLRLRIDGGRLWQAPPHEEEVTGVDLDKDQKKLSIYLHPKDTAATVQEALMELVRETSTSYYWFFQLKKRLPSLLLLLPISLTVLFIAFITVWGDLVINWVFLGPNDPTAFGLPMNESAILYALLAIVVIYFFPVLFTGEQEGFVEALNERFSNREELRKRLVELLKLLQVKEVVEELEIWNPDLGNEELDWVGKSLLPAILELQLPSILQTRIDDRPRIENYFQEQVGTETTIVWEEKELPPVGWTDEQPIPYSYLQTWEKSLLGVYVFASTASMPTAWCQLEGDLREGVLQRAVSLRLVKILIEKFKERLFLEEDIQQLISLDLFASRCLNDYGILGPSLHYTHDVWSISEQVVETERGAVEEEMKYLFSYLQTEVSSLILLVEDPVAALKLNSVQSKVSIYNEERLATIRFFIEVIDQSEQYKILKQYWSLVIKQPPQVVSNREDIYRIIGVDYLLKLATIFERSGLYQQANVTLDYLERVFPFRGKVGKARIQERQGDFESSVQALLAIRTAWQKQELTLQDKAVIALNLDSSWAIVSGRLENYRAIGEECLAEAKTLLNRNFDSMRSSEQTISLYNILANYEEWAGRPEGALENYDKALQIPGVSQSGLSNLLVNKGIALRQQSRLAEGAQFGEQGVAIKAAIGDADQLPIAQHNLAQTYLELARESPPKEHQHQLQQAIKHASDGLALQAQTGSVKKKGQLLTECFLGYWNLPEQGAADKKAQHYYWSKLQEWLLEQQGKEKLSYDAKVVMGELLGSYTPWEGLDLDGLINWKLP
ncbi:MAG: hypothetical protein ACRBFS_24240 [Aureispira sp.]